MYKLHAGKVDITDKEKEYIDGQVKAIDAEHPDKPVTDVLLKIGDDGMLEIAYRHDEVKFERIRRITGYLVGTVDRWNNAKKSEEHDRVKHTVGG